MSRHFVSIILSVIFLAFVSAPTIVTMVDESIDVSFYFSYAEEEEQGHSKNLSKEILALEDQNSASIFFLSLKGNSIVYVFKNYANPYLNFVAPPPDFT